MTKIGKYFEIAVHELVFVRVAGSALRAGPSALSGDETGIHRALKDTRR